MNFLHDRGKAAIIYKDREYSYKELITGIKYYSTLLKIKKGDKVVVYIENRPEIIEALFSIWNSKGIGVVLDVYKRQVITPPNNKIIAVGALTTFIPNMITSIEIIRISIA